MYVEILLDLRITVLGSEKPTFIGSYDFICWSYNVGIHYVWKEDYEGGKDINIHLCYKPETSLFQNKPHWIYGVIIMDSKYNLLFLTV